MSSPHVQKACVEPAKSTWSKAKSITATPFSTTTNAPPIPACSRASRAPCPNAWFLTCKELSYMTINSTTRCPFSGAPATVEEPAEQRTHAPVVRSEEHTSELQSRGHIVC